jgi:hypothetical protein
MLFQQVHQSGTKTPQTSWKPFQVTPHPLPGQPIQSSSTPATIKNQAFAQPDWLTSLTHQEATLRTQSAALIQLKLAIGQSSDRYEQEADRAAEQVMRMSTPAIPQPIPREMRLEGEIQTKPTLRQIEGSGGLEVPQSWQSRLTRSGSPLPDDVRAFMEPRFGADFSQVRVHTDSETMRMNRDLHAQAFTHKQDIYFGAGKAPAKDALTAHELAHVVQQAGADAVRVRQGSEPQNSLSISSVSSGVRLQRLGLEDLDFIGGSLERLAKLNFSVPLCKDLIDHYCSGQGIEMGLTALAMVQCNAVIDFGNQKRSPQFLRFVNQMGAEIARNAGGDPTRLQNHPFESNVSFSMLGLCNTSGTLGDFTVNASGKLKVWNPNEDGTDADWSFEGNMWWYDRWDFDKRSASGKGEPGRTSKGSWRTDVGSLLVGIPFDIKTAAVPVRQARADAKGENHYAKWQGNPEGKPLPVISGLL